MENVYENFGAKLTNKNKIRRVVLDIARKRRQIIYGQQAVNYHLPKHLQRKTKDYDVYTDKPEESANELKEKLSKEFKRTNFTVEPALHPGTFKVKKGKTTIADYTLIKKKPKSTNNFGVRYTELNYQEKKIKNILKNKDNEFRFKKDKDTLNKINQYNEGVKKIW